jgi:hypothetical protein
MSEQTELTLALLRRDLKAIQTILIGMVALLGLILWRIW